MIFGTEVGMADFSRRRLLTSAMGIGGMAAAASLLPPNLQRAMAEPADRPGSLDDIEHVVILMQENRSFDHYFGTMRGVRGFDDPGAITLSTGRSVFHQPDQANPDGYLLPFHLDTRTTSSQAIPSTSHAWTVQHQAWNGGAMDNWLPAHRQADGDTNGPYTMGYYERADIPFHFALAESFTLCDAYHCSLLGPTWPNRLYHWSGTIDPNGLAGGPIISNVVPEPFRWTTYPERLTRAGVSWHVYQQEDDYGCNPLEFFQSYQDARPGDPLYEHGLTIGPADQFARDAMNGRLPTVSWIIPTAGQCEHPRLPPGGRRRLHGPAAGRGRGRPRAVAQDRLHPQLRRERRPVRPRRPADPAARHPGRVRRRRADRRRHPRAVHRRLALDARRLRRQRAVRPHLGAALPGAADRGARDEHQRLAAPHVRRPDLRVRLPGAHASPSRPALDRPGVRAAEQEVATLPPVTPPGAQQSPPHQESAGPPRPRRRSRRRPPPRDARRAVPYTRSRIEENRTTHRATSRTAPRAPASPASRRRYARTAPTTGDHVYAVGIVSFTVVAIDPATRQLVASVKAGANPIGLTRPPTAARSTSATPAPATSRCWTPRGAGSSAASRSASTRTAWPTSPDGRRVYVANTGPDTGPGGSRTVSVIDTATDTVTATWRHRAVAPLARPSPDGRALYVTCHDGLSVLDTGCGRTARC